MLSSWYGNLREEITMNEQELNVENMQENIDDYNRKVAKKRILVTCVAYLLTVLAVGYFIFFKFFNKANYYLLSFVYKFAFVQQL